MPPSGQLLTKPLAEAPHMRSQVYDRIREAILSGELPAGSTVSPSDLAESLGISTMPVREALRVLEDDGLIETSARRWSRVATPGAEVADELYPLVALLEAFAITNGDPPTERLLDRLSDANRELESAGAKEDVPGCIKADTKFHATLVSTSSNQSLIRIIDDLKARISLLESTFFRSERVKLSVTQHDKIVAALSAGDMDAVSDAIKANWLSSLEPLHAALDTEGESCDGQVIQTGVTGE